MRNFKTGQSGISAASLKGALNRETLSTQSWLDGEAEPLTRKVVERAKGD